MCGIVGFCGNDNFDISKIKMLMLSNIVRGIDSTGIYNEGKITKEATSCEKFLSNHPIVSEKIFIGHTRKATTNIISAQTAHPFQKDNIIGVHNGGIFNKYTIERVLNLKPVDYEVDSELLIDAISQNKLKLVLQELDGAAALIWVDVTKPDTLFCLRNKERPLFRGMTKEGIYLSSLKESLLTIGINNENIKEIPEDRLFILKNGVIENNWSMPKSCIKKYATQTVNNTPYFKQNRTTEVDYDNDTDDVLENVFATFKYGDVVNSQTTASVPNGYYYVIRTTGLFTEVFNHHTGKPILIATSLLRKTEELKIGDYANTIFFSPIWKEKFNIEKDSVYIIRGIDFNDNGKIVHCAIVGKSHIIQMPARFLIKIQTPTLQLPIPLELEGKVKLTDNDSIPLAKTMYDKIEQIKINMELLYMEIDSAGLFDCVLEGQRLSFDNIIVDTEIILADISSINENE